MHAISKIRDMFENGVETISRYIAERRRGAAARPQPLPGEVRAVLLLFFTIVVLRNAWVGDDAHIILRSIDNFVNGLGLTFNPSERVQAFTCPLWTLMLSLVYAITREGYYTTIALSLLVSVTTVYLVISRVAETPFAALIAAIVLLLSRAFVDYATSGLENAATHLLLVLHFLAVDRLLSGDNRAGTFFSAWFFFALLLLNRLDIAFLLAPVQVSLLRYCVPFVSRARIAAAAFLPLVLWFGFSLFYYGFPLPNTAYAKLATGISAPALLRQGLFYLRNSLVWDPLTPLTIGAAVLGALVLPHKARAHRTLLALGILLHLAYIAKVGGDHMAGRFLTPAFMVAVLMLASMEVRETLSKGIVLTLAVAAGFMGANPTPLFAYKPENKGLDPAAIADEREFCFKHYGLFYQSRALSLVNNYLGNRGTRHRRSGAHVLVDGHIGLFGYYAGPSLHLIDPLALTDPLLARLPVAFGKHWRTGHYFRDVPAGYVEAVEGTGVIADADLNAYYAHLRSIISGGLWRRDRLREIVDFNLGAFDHLKEKYVDRSVGIKDYAELSTLTKPGGLPWNEQDNLVLNTPGIGVRISRHEWDTACKERRRFTVSLAGGYVYDLLFLFRGRVIARDEIDLSRKTKDRLAVYRGALPSSLGSNAVDLIRIKPRDTFGSYSIGHFRFERAPRVIDAPLSTPIETAIVFDDRDVDITMPRMVRLKRLTFDAPVNSAYKLLFFNRRRLVWQTGVVVDNWDSATGRRVDIPRDIDGNGIDRIRVVPTVGPIPPKIDNLSLDL